jgi:hypothetical protein
MVLQRVHDRQFGGARIAEQMRDALVLEQCEDAERPVMRFMKSSRSPRPLPRA